MKKQTEVENDGALAKFIAIVIRNAMEDFHVQHLSDRQMKELNPIIRNAVFTALHALHHITESAGARTFVEFQSLLIPDYWEEPSLLEDYIATLGLKDADLKLASLWRVASQTPLSQTGI